ncbi:hypothetical protein C2857_005758 [Epichloe festucae Fl1]|uniref:DUF6546 domain-containing protein n=1 Tax=Epichloe festucae (strain Fl1) TaxID=877507 RepID=A0A7S9KPN7_EPIFF|nr:hypothetical protein C2857_005758 [Epichloe festucae Fl1]
MASRNSTYLPFEIILMVARALVEDDDNLARFATVSRDWQRIIESHNFAQIRLTPSRIAELDVMTRRNRGRVRYLWLCLELEQYGCSPPSPKTLVMKAFQDLFSVLRAWEPNGFLSLDVSVYSTSNAEHCFNYITSEPDLPKKGSHDQEVGQGRMARARAAISRSLDFVDKFEWDEDEEGEYGEERDEWWRHLPPVPAVTRLLLRQQTRQRWTPQALANILALLPRLRELYYEPFRAEQDDSFEEFTDFGNPHHAHMDAVDAVHADDADDTDDKDDTDDTDDIDDIDDIEHVYPLFPPAVQDYASLIRPPNHALSEALATVSRNLESISGAFMVDAGLFFGPISYPFVKRRPNLKTLVLTSQLLAPDERQKNIVKMLQEAASAAMHMPQLETMTIWNGRRKLAALFKYERTREHQISTVTWRGTWHFNLPPSLIKAWEAVAAKYSGYGLDVVHESLDGDDVMSHGDAIAILKLPELVIRPVSLQQIRRDPCWR